MILYRIALKRFANDLSGEGARLYGGRWNSKGIPVVYTSESRSLAFAEMLVNTSFGLVQQMPELFSLIALQIPDRIKITEVPLKDLPSQWNAYPHLHDVCRIGDSWLRENKELLLRVPSAVVRGEYNVLLNPLHRDLKKIKITLEGFPFDERLVKK